MNLVIILQTLAFFALPLLLGRALWCLFAGKKQAEPWVGYYAAGALVIFAWAMSLHYLFGLVGAIFVSWFFGGAWVFSALALVCNVFYRPKLKLNELMPIFLLVGLALGVYNLWTWQNPYPLNWDFYQHQQLARLIQHGEISFFTTEMSDTFGFNSYSPLFHALMALSQYPHDLAPEYLLNYWQLMTFWQILAVGLAAYCLGSAVTNKRMIGVFAGVLSMLIFDSHVSLTTFFLMPQTLAAVLFTLMMARLLRVKAKISSTELAVSSLTLVLMHYLIGGVGALVYLALAVYLKLPKRFTVVAKLHLIPTAALMILGGSLLVGQLPLSGLNQGEGKLYALDFWKIKESLERAFGYLLYVLAPMGMIRLWKGGIKQETKALVSLIAFAFGVLVFSGIPYALKFMSVWRFWLILLMAIGLYSLWERIKFVGTKLIFTVVVVFSLLAILMVNLMCFRSGIMTDGVYAHLTQEDIEAAEWLKENYAQETVLISDPSTQFILEGLSGVDSVAGAYMPLSKRQILWPSFYSRRAEKIVSAARELTIGSEVSLLVLSGRSMAWGRANDEQWQSFAYNVWSPIMLSLEDKKLIEQVSQTNGVKLVYQNGAIAIWEVKNEK